MGILIRYIHKVMKNDKPIESAITFIVGILC